MKKSELRQFIRNVINEEFLGTIFAQNQYSINYDWQTVDIYKNPKSIKNFDDASRGYITKDGDLYLTDVPELLHNQIENILKNRLNVRNLSVPVVKVSDYEIELLRQNSFKYFDVNKFDKKIQKHQ